MADISLKDYLDNVEAVLSSGTNDQVLHQCRHILRYYPKNVATYRYLGEALLHSSNLDEAGEIFRRVLSVFPDDATAHMGLSEINERQGKGNEALWHLERAFEQDPNNQQITQKLRELYRRFRQIDQNRLQLTSGAVARQYLRSGLYDQAMETLQSTLEKSPKRADLRLMLAKAMWAAGLEVEAAENALEVLKLLPDSLEANEILTRLWLTEGRPSDAQRYLSHIEAVDPYRALEIVQGTPAPADAFMLPEMDYGSVTPQRVQTRQPEWLDEIDEQAQQDDWMSGLDSATVADNDADSFDDDSSEVPADWLLESSPDDAPLDDLFGSMNESTFDASGSGLTGLLDALDDGEQETAADVADLFGNDADMPDFDFDQDELPQSDWLSETPEATDEDSVLDADPMAWLQDDGGSDEDVPDWMQADESDFAGTSTLPESGSLIRGTDDEDPLAWMQTSGVEMADPNAPAEPLFGLDDEDEMTFQDPSEVDPFAWMQSSGIEIDGEEAVDFFADLDNAPQAAAAEDDDDPLAWMRDSGVDVIEDSEEVTDLPTVSSLLNTPEKTTGEMDWLNDEGLLDEILDIEELTQTGTLGTGSLRADVPAEEPESPEMAMSDSAAGWLDDEPSGEPEPDGDAFNLASDWQNDMSDPNENELPDWLSSDSSAEDDAFSWLNEEPAEQPQNVPLSMDDENALDWMVEVGDETDDDNDLGWLTDAAPIGELDSDDDDVEPENAGLEWLAGIEDDEEEIEAVSETPDWLADAAPVAEFGSDEDDEPAESNDFAWMSSGEDEDEEAVGQTPDWLADAAPVAEFGSDNDDESNDFAWMSSDEDEEEEAVGETPDWLADAGPVAEFDSNDDEVEPENAGLEWLAGIEDDEEEIEAAGETPDWLTEAAPVAEFGSNDDDEPDESNDFAWMSSDEDEESEAVGETPDWLADAAPVAELHSDDDDVEPENPGLEWLSGIEDDEEEIEAAGETPDWLSDAAPVAEFGADEDEPAESNDFAWMSSDEDEEEAEAVGETPDWLSDVAPVAEFGSDEDDEPAESNDFAWMSSDEDEESEAVGETPDWLSDAAPVAEFGSDGDEEPVAGNDFAWMSSDEDEEESEAVGETPDWLTEAAPVTDFSSESENVVPDNQFEWLSDDDEEAESEQLEWLASDEVEPVETTESTGNAYEWLAIDDQEEAESSQLEWLEAGEEAVADAQSATPIDDTPDWLSEAMPAAELDAEEDDAGQQEDFTWEVEQEPDWLSEIPGPNEEPEEPSAQTADDEVPLWLAEAAPNVLANQQPQTDWEAEGAMEYDNDASESEFGWLGDDEEEVSDYAPDYLTSEAAYEPEYGESDDEKILAAAQKPPPAENAPSWLNEMVPGLDLEYDAPEDEPIETEFVEPAATEDSSEFAVSPQKSKDFNWLVEIVDEETNQVETVSEAEAAPAKPAARQSRFTFKRRPAWLRRIGGQAEKPASDDPDFELPDWLR